MNSCFTLRTLECKPALSTRLIPKAETPKFNAYRLTKLTLRPDAYQEGLRISDLLKEIDPSHTVTVPTETVCVLRREAERSIMRGETECAGLRESLLTEPDARVTQVTMRMGILLYQFVDENKDKLASYVFDIIHSFMGEMYKIFHNNELVPGNVAEDDLVVSDGVIRVRDLHGVFRYDLGAPAIAGSTWRERLEALDDAGFQRALALHPAVAQIGLASLPPSNIFMNPDALFNQDVVAAFACYDEILVALEEFGEEKVHFKKHLDAILRKVDMFRTLGKDAMYIKTNILPFYEPELYTIYQLGYVLLQLYMSLKDSLGDSYPGALLRRIISKMLTQDISWSKLLTSMDFFLEKLRKEESGISDDDEVMETVLPSILLDPASKSYLVLSMWEQDAVKFKEFSQRERDGLIEKCKRMPSARFNKDVVNRFVGQTAFAAGVATNDERVRGLYATIMYRAYDSVRYVETLEVVKILDEMSEILNRETDPTRLCLWVPETDEWSKSYNFFAMIAASRLNFKYAALQICSEAWPSPEDMRDIEFVFADDVAYSCTQLGENVAELHSHFTPDRLPFLHPMIPYMYKCLDDYAHGPLGPLIRTLSANLPTSNRLMRDVDVARSIDELRYLQAFDPARYGDIAECLVRWIEPQTLREAWTDRSLLYTQFRVPDEFSAIQEIIYGHSPFTNVDDAVVGKAREFLQRNGWNMLTEFEPQRLQKEMFECGDECFKRDYSIWFKDIACPIEPLTLPKWVDLTGDLRLLAYHTRLVLQMFGKTKALEYMRLHSDPDKLTDEQIAEVVGVLAHGLPQPAVAEGVETAFDADKNEYLGAGGFGCVQTKSYACALGTHKQLSKPSDPADVVYKIQAGNEMDPASIQAVLDVVDKNSDYTVPFESQCTLTDSAALHAREACSPIADKPASHSVIQISMRRGIVYSQYLYESAGTVPLRVQFERVLSVFRGVAKMDTYAISHGDIKASNMLFFPSDGVVRLMDYDGMFAYGLDEPPVPKLQSTHNWRTDLLTPAHLATFRRLIDICVLGLDSYFPPDNAYFMFALHDVRTTAVDTGDFSKDVALYYRQPPMGYDAAMWFAELGVITREIANLRASNLLTPAFALEHLFFPEKHSVFQLGRVLEQMCGTLKTRLEAEQSEFFNRSITELVCNMLRPMAKDRITIAEACASLEGLCSML